MDFIIHVNCGIIAWKTSKLLRFFNHKLIKRVRDISPSDNIAKVSPSILFIRFLLSQLIVKPNVEQSTFT